MIKLETSCDVCGKIGTRKERFNGKLLCLACLGKCRHRINWGILDKYNCSNCGKAFLSHKSIRAGNKKNYCSNKCRLDGEHLGRPPIAYADAIKKIYTIRPVSPVKNNKNKKKVSGSSGRVYFSSCLIGKKFKIEVLK